MVRDLNSGRPVYKTATMALGSHIVTATKLKGMRLTGHGVHMRETRNICNIRVGKF
jgi:hypothetical protein